MSEISATRIATSRYASGDAARVELFNYNGAEDMTISQLVIAVQVRRCASLERETVLQINMMNRGVERIDTLSTHAETVLQALSETEEDEAGTDSEQTKASRKAKKAWLDTIKPYLVALGIAEKDLPADIETYGRKMEAMEQIKNRLTMATSSVDRVAIEIETCINRRDSMYKIATECVVHGGASAMNAAANCSPS